MIIKETVNPNYELYSLSLTCGAIHPSRLFWCELPSFKGVDLCDVFIFLNITDVDGTWLMLLREIHLVPKNKFDSSDNSTVMSLAKKSLHQTPLHHHVEGNVHVLEWRLLLVM